MENIVSARRLRKTLLNTNENYSFLVNTDNINKNNKFVNKFLIQAVISSILLFVTIFLVNNYKNEMLENKVINRLYQHYKFNFSKELIINNFEIGIKNINNVMGDIIPENIKCNIINSYNSAIKPFILSFNLKNILTNSSKNEVEIYVYNGNNFAYIQNLNEEKFITTNADVNLNNISIILPTTGIVTSRFGNREKIFEELSTYHTGIDIGNKIGTNILSSTTGTIKKVKYNDKYYGNYIEIETLGYIFKYAHLSEIIVNEGQQINQGEIIGKMGSTGMSTGPHLHFEIKKDNVVIDPESVIKF